MPILVLNNWQGMLGNTIIQVYNSLLIAIDKKYNILLPDPTDKHKFSKYSKFYKKRKIVVWENSDNKEIKNRYNFYYQKWMPEYSESFEKNHDKAVKLLKEVLVICNEELQPINKETLIIHMRSGDIFANCPHPKYIPPYLSFYKEILNENNYNNVLITTENSRNPCLKPLEKLENVKWTGGNLTKDIKMIMSAKHLVFGIGSFVPSLLLLSNNIEKIYVPSNYGIPTIFEGESCLFGKKVEIKEYDISDYIDRIGNEGVRSRHARDIMLAYPKEVPKIEVDKKEVDKKEVNKKEERKVEKKKVIEKKSQHVKIDTIIPTDEINKDEIRNLKIAKIIIRANNYLDQIIFVFTNNKCRFYGKKGGRVVKEIILEENEKIKSVNHIHGSMYLGHGINIKTSLDKTYEVLAKKEASEDYFNTLKAGDDEEIIGLNFQENRVVGIETRKI